MPAWWRGKARPKAKPKAPSFRGERQVCHPLPRPAEQGSAYPSSESSSGEEEEEVTDLFRYIQPQYTLQKRSRTPDQKRQHIVEDKQLLSRDPVVEHGRLANILVNPRSKLQSHGFDNHSIGVIRSHHQVASETKVTLAPRSRTCIPPTSPVSSRAFVTGPELPMGIQEGVRSLSHPLPLPPGSPISPPSRSPRSKWKKGKLLGKGTFGHVYSGFNSENGQMCAVKEVQFISDDSNSKECLRQLSQEINLLSQLSHSNIVQYYGSELVDDTLSVYLEYVSGGSIYKLLQDYGPFPESVIRNYTGQILSGLAYLHGRNTIHRDIKGANILVDPNGEIKLADFGMAKHISSCTSIQSFKGSPYWMAPEVVMNQNSYNMSVDIWSLGCTLIEMGTSKPPWNQYTGVQAIFKIGNSKDIPKIPEHLSDEGKRFLKLCLQRDPSARPTAAQLLNHPFVRDHLAKVKLAVTVSENRVKHAYPSTNEGSHTLTTRDVFFNRSSLTMLDRDCPIRQNTVVSSSNQRAISDLVSLGLPMSLPASPCSSPLRQIKRPNWSCLPSPRPPGANYYGLSATNSPHRSRKYSDCLQDTALVKISRRT